MNRLHLPKIDSAKRSARVFFLDTYFLTIVREKDRLRR